MDWLLVCLWVCQSVLTWGEGGKSVESQKLLMYVLYSTKERGMRLIDAYLDKELWMFTSMQDSMSNRRGGGLMGREGMEAGEG